MDSNRFAVFTESDVMQTSFRSKQSQKQRVIHYWQLTYNNTIDYIILGCHLRRSDLIKPDAWIRLMKHHNKTESTLTEHRNQPLFIQELTDTQPQMMSPENPESLPI